MTFDISKEKQVLNFINNIEAELLVFNPEYLSLSQECDPVNNRHLSIAVAYCPSSHLKSQLTPIYS